ncbi:MAG: hypothetical protein HYX50_00435 [Chloroflexi bacterium]|nr:hypothetical protein [Chloroflexota bacterium]
MSLQANAPATEHRAGDGFSGLASPGGIALALTATAWAIGIAMLLAHRIFVTNDSLSNYIHVWYVAERFWHGHGVPIRMPVLGHGDALAFPYAFIPWMSAALVRPLLGDWVVTLWLAVGAIGLVAAQWWAFPELRGGWWTAMLLANPILVEAPLLGQLPFLWATAMLFAAVALWRRDRPVLAAVALGAAQATHPAVLLPIAGVLILARLPSEPRRRTLLVTYLASLVIAAPATVLVLASPSVGDASPSALVGNFFGTVLLRAVVVEAPFIGLALQRTSLARTPALLWTALITANLVLVPVRQNQYAWGALIRTPDVTLRQYTGSPQFHAGATYRILRVGDGKVGMYQLLTAGARLDAEPFPESIGRRSFPSTTAYLTFLRRRDVQYVLIYDAYDLRYRTNEHRLLAELSTDPAGCVRTDSSGAGFTVYRINAYDC